MGLVAYVQLSEKKLEDDDVKGEAYKHCRTIAWYGTSLHTSVFFFRKLKSNF